MEYLGTDMYLNFYVTGTVIIFSAQISLLFYKPLGLRILMQLVSFVMIVSALFIISVQQKWIRLARETQEVLFINYSIPLSLIFLSMACQTGFIAI